MRNLMLPCSTSPRAPHCRRSDAVRHVQQSAIACADLVRREYRGLRPSLASLNPITFDTLRLSEIGSGIVTQVSVEKILGFRQSDLHVTVALQLQTEARTRAPENVSALAMVRRKEVQMVSTYQAAGVIRPRGVTTR